MMGSELMPTAKQVLQEYVDQEGLSGFECYDSGSELPVCRCYVGKLLTNCTESCNLRERACLPFCAAERG